MLKRQVGPRPNHRNGSSIDSVVPIAWIASVAALLMALGCPATSFSAGPEPEKFGVLVMAHGGSPEWNQAVLKAVAPLREQYRVEVAFGMADAATIQDGVRTLEADGVRRIGVVRLFVSGESWYERTEQILGLRPGTPVDFAAAHTQPAARHANHGHAHHHNPVFFRIETASQFALSKQGLADAAEMGKVLADRARNLSREPENEEVLVLAHGPGDDEENERWLTRLDARADEVRRALPFHAVQVDTLREDWPKKRAVAERRIRAFVSRASRNGRRAIVIPFRVHGFGPYAEVLDGLEYSSNGLGLLPDGRVSQWIARQAAGLRAGPFRTPLEPTNPQRRPF